MRCLMQHDNPPAAPDGSYGAAVAELWRQLDGLCASVMRAIGGPTGAAALADYAQRCVEQARRSCSWAAIGVAPEQAALIEQAGLTPADWTVFAYGPAPSSASAAARIRITRTLAALPLGARRRSRRERKRKRR